MFRPKMIITDLDGTVLRNDKTLSTRTIKAFENAKCAGIIIAIATARYITSAFPYAKSLCANYRILTDGTMIFKDNSIIYSNTMDLDTTNTIIHECVINNCISHIAIPANNNLYRYPEGEIFTSQFQNAPEYTPSDINTDNTTPKTGGLPSVDNGNFDLRGLKETSDGHTSGIHFEPDSYFPYPANKMVVEIDSPQLAKHISQVANCSYFRYTGEDRYTFYSNTAGKDDAVKNLSRICNVPLDEIICFGDDINDIKMLQCCGLGVAMGNSTEDVKKSANIITESNENDGVALIIEDFLK